jgi:hypothetical protein
MNISRFVSIGVCALLSFGLQACTPENTAAPAEGSEPAAVAVPSEPPVQSPAAAPAVATPATDEAQTQLPAAVDTSIREAAEFGDDSLLEGLAPEGWKQSGKIEHYNVASLYDKINGRSELYMAYDVVGLSWVSFAQNDDPNFFMDVFLYDMRTPTGAFGIYSVEREPDQPKVDLGREGYRTESNYYFWKGKYYCYIQTSLDTDVAVAAGLGVAQKVAERLGDSGEPVIGLDLVPLDGLVADSIQYFKADAMSLDFMTDTFTAKYPVDGTVVTAFMTRRASEDDAKTVAAEYLKYFEEYGEGTTKETIDGVEFAFSDLGGGFHDGVFQSGALVAGVSAVEGKDAARAATLAVARKLNALPPAN